jgi:hypothetical protein
MRCEAYIEWIMYSKLNKGAATARCSHGEPALLQCTERLCQAAICFVRCFGITLGKHRFFNVCWLTAAAAAACHSDVLVALYVSILATL